MHHPTDRITYTTAFVIPVEHWLEREIAQCVHPMKDRSDDPSHHERTLYPPLRPALMMMIIMIIMMMMIIIMMIIIMIMMMMMMMIMMMIIMIIMMIMIIMILVIIIMMMMMMIIIYYHVVLNFNLCSTPRSHYYIITNTGKLFSPVLRRKMLQNLYISEMSKSSIQSFFNDLSRNASLYKNTSAR